MFQFKEILTKEKKNIKLKILFEKKQNKRILEESTHKGLSEESSPSEESSLTKESSISSEESSSNEENRSRGESSGSSDQSSILSEELSISKKE